MRFYILSLYSIVPENIVWEDWERKRPKGIIKVYSLIHPCFMPGVLS